MIIKKSPLKVDNLKETIINKEIQLNEEITLEAGDMIFINMDTNLNPELNEVYLKNIVSNNLKYDNYKFVKILYNMMYTELNEKNYNDISDINLDYLLEKFTHTPMDKLNEQYENCQVNNNDQSSIIKEIHNEVDKLVDACDEI